MNIQKRIEANPEQGFSPRTGRQGSDGGGSRKACHVRTCSHISSYQQPVLEADPSAIATESRALPRVYRETVVVDDGVIIVGVLTGEVDPQPTREFAG